MRICETANHYHDAKHSHYAKHYYFYFTKQSITYSFHARNIQQLRNIVTTILYTRVIKNFFSEGSAGYQQFEKATLYTFTLSKNYPPILPYSTNYLTRYQFNNITKEKNDSLQQSAFADDYHRSIHTICLCGDYWSVGIFINQHFNYVFLTTMN